MKHFFKQIIKSPMLILFIVMTVFLGFPALGQTAEISQYAIVTALGIDKIEEGEDKFEVSFLTFIPIAQQGFAEKYKVISAKGRSVAEAMDFAGLELGREIGLSHLKLIALNQELFKEDISMFLDYLVRNKEITTSVRLIATDKSAQDFLKAAQKLDSESSIKVSDLVAYNTDYIYAADSTLESFYKSMLGPTRVGLISFLTTEKEEGVSAMADAEGQNGQSSGAGQGGGTESGAEEIKNLGETAVFKDGMLKLNLSGKDMKKINIIKGSFTTGSLNIRNYSDEEFDNCNLTFEIFKKNLKYHVVFQNGIPVVTLDLQINLKLSEVEDKDGIFRQNIEIYVLSKDVEDAIEKKIKTVMSEGIEIMRDNQIDLADFYTFINNTHKKEFEQFLDRLEERDNYLSHIVFKTNIYIIAS